MSLWFYLIFTSPQMLLLKPPENQGGQESHLYSEKENHIHCKGHSKKNKIKPKIVSTINLFNGKKAQIFTLLGLRRLKYIKFEYIDFSFNSLKTVGAAVIMGTTPVLKMSANAVTGD